MCCYIELVRIISFASTDFQKAMTELECISKANNIVIYSGNMVESGDRLQIIPFTKIFLNKMMKS